MGEKIFVVACNFCGRKQQTIVRKGSFPNGRKICVYCGKNFKIGKENTFMRIR